VILIPLNAALAIRQLRDRDAEVLVWIDCFCINQEGLDERKSRIMLMASVYGQAE